MQKLPEVERLNTIVPLAASFLFRRPQHRSRRLQNRKMLATLKTVNESRKGLRRKTIAVTTPAIPKPTESICALVLRRLENTYDTVKKQRRIGKEKEDKNSILEEST